MYCAFWYIKNLKYNAKDKVDRGVSYVRNRVIANQFGKSAFGRYGESFLGDLAFGLEGVLVDDDEDNDIYPMSGKGFNPDAQGDDMIEEADEMDLEDLADESFIAVMLAEDGFDD